MTQTRISSALAAALIAAAAMTACGGGDLVEGPLPSDGSSVNGTFAVCEPVGVPVAIASRRTVVTVSDTGLGLSIRNHIGTSCSGPSFATIEVPVIVLAQAGTKTVASPGGGSDVTARRVNMTRGAGQISWQSADGYARINGTVLEVLDPSQANRVLYTYGIAFPALADKDLVAVVNGRLYFGNTTDDAQGYPTALDSTYSYPRQ